MHTCDLQKAKAVTSHAETIDRIRLAWLEGKLTIETDKYHANHLAVSSCTHAISNVQNRTESDSAVLDSRFDHPHLSLFRTTCFFECSFHITPTASTSGLSLLFFRVSITIETDFPTARNQI